MNRFQYIFVILLLIISTSVVGGCGSQKTSDISVAERSPNVNYSDANSPEIAQQAEVAQDPVSIERKIVQNADIDLRVQNVSEVVEQIIALCDQNGGYTVNSHLYRDEERVSAQLSIKVPQPQLSSIITAISQLGEVTDKIITTQDVTEEYYDAQARLKVLKAKEERLLGLMSKAANITEVISVENELGKTRGEIEVLAGRLKYLSNATAYSLIKIDLRQGIPGTLKAPQGTLGKAAQGLVSSLNHLIDFASHTVVFLVIILPWILVIFLLFLLVRYIYQKRQAVRHKNEQE